MSDKAVSWPALSFLEGLRPAPGGEVELALLASYSADLGSIGAALLALAGKDTDAGSGSPTDFADAVERLRGKVRIVIQRGRLAKMQRTPRIAAVLDQFVREVAFDEAFHSWHPKAALVRARSSDGKVDWRLWIGSRNLTECVNRDIGLLLLSAEKGGTLVPGVDDLARDLAERAALRGVRSASLASAIKKVAWREPPGVTVERVCWSQGFGDQPVPEPLVNAEELVIVSPFVDKEFLNYQFTKVSMQTRRILLTTVGEIERVGPSLSTLDQLLALDAPDYPIADPESAVISDSSDTNDEEEEIGRGLHAKLLFMHAGRKRILWLGSANATMRAWTGRNAEVTAELCVTEAIQKGLKALIDSARFVAVPENEYQPDAAMAEDKAIERARAQVAARWAATLSIDGEMASLVHASDLYAQGPHPDEPDFLLEIGALHGGLAIWPPGQNILQLGLMPAAERSEFVRVRVSRRGRGLSWLQRAPADPPFGKERDRAAFVRFLGARGFLLWLAGLLADDDRDQTDDWKVEKPQERTGGGANPLTDAGLPTLEEMLAAWSRDREKFREIGRRVSEYLPAVRQQALHEDSRTVELLQRFEDLWGKLLAGLGNERIGLS